MLALHSGWVFGAKTDFRLARDPDVVLGPDVAFVRAERVPPTDPFLELAPDLVVEIVSPTDRPADMRAGVQAYLRHAVQLLLVVEPRRQQVTVHWPEQPLRLLNAGEDLDGQEVLPGFRLPLTELFASF